MSNLKIVIRKIFFFALFLFVASISPLKSFAADCIDNYHDCGDGNVPCCGAPAFTCFEHYCQPPANTPTPPLVITPTPSPTSVSTPAPTPTTCVGCHYGSPTPACGMSVGDNCCPGGTCSSGLVCDTHDHTCEISSMFTIAPTPTPGTSVFFPGFCNGETGIDTALGCIPINNTSEFVNWFFGNFMGIAGGIALLLMIFGAFQIITSGGNPEKVKQGQAYVTSAISGLLFMIFSLFLLRFIGVDLLSLPGLNY
ncbi:MAG: hypothetical protein ABIB61_04455 [Candidatus Shapirobacteria bacterium]